MTQLQQIEKILEDNGIEFQTYTEFSNKDEGVIAFTELTILGEIVNETTLLFENETFVKFLTAPTHSYSGKDAPPQYISKADNEQLSATENINFFNAYAKSKMPFF